jgi:Methyltransferase domain
MSIPAMTTMLERGYYYHLALEAAGKGGIVELGAWLGAGTEAIAQGIRDSGFKNKVHSYDRFRWDPRTHGPKAGGLKVEDLYKTYKANLGPLMEFVEPHKGEIESYTWSGEPIALMICDAPKRLKPVAHVMSAFGPHLMPGATMAWQDFCYPPAYAIAACLYRFRNRMEYRDAVNDTVSFRIREPWKAELATVERLDPANWSADDVLEAVAYWRSVLPHEQNISVLCGATLFLSDLGYPDQGRTILRPLIKADPKLEEGLLHIKKTRPILANRYKALFREIG